MLHKELTSEIINYLKATDTEVGLILNFGPKPTFARRVFTKNNKMNPR